MSFNKVILMGNLTRDPEVRYIGDKNTALCEFSLAVNDNISDEVSFFDCKAWGRTAEVMGEYCQKGRPILVEGRLKQESWENDEGAKRSKVVVVVQTMQLLGKGNKESDGDDEPAKPKTRKKKQETSAKKPPVVDDNYAEDEDDVPF